jgi:hypothetical protein
VNDLRGDIKAFIEERDWEQFHSPKNLAMALRACFKTASLASGVTTANLSRPVGARSCLVGACNVRDN